MMIDRKSPISHLEKLLRPKQEWRVLVLAADKCGLALDLAPFVNLVTLVCPTVVHAQRVEKIAAISRISNVNCKIHNPEDLPYTNDSFDLLVCQHMAHTFNDLDGWLREADRILRPEGLAAVETLLVPGTRLRGKKARRLREAAEYLNAFFQLHSQKPYSYASKNNWEDLLVAAGFEIQKLETAERIVDFSVWTDEVSLSWEDRLRLKVMLVQAPEKASEFLTPKFSGDRILFRHPEITILANSKANTD